MGVLTSVLALIAFNAHGGVQTPPNHSGLPVLKQVMAQFQAKDSAIVSVERLEQTGIMFNYSGQLTIWRKGNKYKGMYGGMWGDGLTMICDGKQMSIDDQYQVTVVPAPANFAAVGDQGDPANWRNMALALFTKPEDIGTFIDLKSDISLKETGGDKVVLFKHKGGAEITLTVRRNGELEAAYLRKGFPGFTDDGAVLDSIRLVEIGPNLPDSLFVVQKVDSGS